LIIHWTLCLPCFGFSGTSEASIPFVAPGYTKQPTLGSYGGVSEGAGSRYALEGFDGKITEG
jgi:hypothetical protein